VGQRAFTLERLDLGVEQFVVYGDLAHLGFQPGDLVVAVTAVSGVTIPICEPSSRPTEGRTLTRARITRTPTR
jgi:hypothetical protein